MDEYKPVTLETERANPELGSNIKLAVNEQGDEVGKGSGISTGSIASDEGNYRSEGQ